MGKYGMRIMFIFGGIRRKDLSTEKRAMQNFSSLLVGKARSDELCGV